MIKHQDFLNNQQSIKTNLLPKLSDQISEHLCQNGEACGSTCGLSPFGVRYCTGIGQLSCVLLPRPPTCQGNHFYSLLLSIAIFGN